jgi:HEAT repeat protein
VPTRAVADTGDDDERLPFGDDVIRAARAATPTLAGPDSALAAVLFDALDHVALHEFDLVRERAAWALSRARGPALVAPLIDALASKHWREVAYAAWALGASNDGRAVIPLVGVLTHDAWRVRANAAGALHRLGDPRATDAMRASLGDGAWQVRAEAVQFLGRIGDTDPLHRMLKDPHIAVRSAAESAVGTRRSR